MLGATGNPRIAWANYPKFEAPIDDDKSAAVKKILTEWPWAVKNMRCCELQHRFVFGSVDESAKY
jgi:hypothetical protein